MEVWIRNSTSRKHSLCQSWEPKRRITEEAERVTNLERVNKLGVYGLFRKDTTKTVQDHYSALMRGESQKRVS